MSAFFSTVGTVRPAQYRLFGYRIDGAREVLCTGIPSEAFARHMALSMADLPDFTKVAFEAEEPDGQPESDAPSAFIPLRRNEPPQPKEPYW